MALRAGTGLRYSCATTVGLENANPVPRQWGWRKQRLKDAEREREREREREGSKRRIEKKDRKTAEKQQTGACCPRYTHRLS
jgi:hypothetical protein